MVGAIGYVEGRLAWRMLRVGADVDRHYHREVGKMRAAGVGIVEDDDVAGLQLLIGDCGGDGHGHGAEMDGHVVAHGEDIALRHRKRRRNNRGAL